MSRVTFTMLKPDSVRNGNIGAILDKIIKSGFKIKALILKPDLMILSRIAPMFPFLTESGFNIVKVTLLILCILVCKNNTFY